MSRSVRAVAWIYRQVLNLYPPVFRTLFAAEMQDTFAVLLNEAVQRGVLAVLFLLVREVAGILRGAVTERIRCSSVSRLRNETLLVIGLLLLVICLLGPGGLFMPLLVFYLLLPLVSIVLLRITRPTPHLQRQIGLVLLVASWPLLAFWVGLVVEGWELGVPRSSLGDAATPLTDAYDWLLHWELRRIEYGYIITAISALICSIRLVRTPRASRAPFLFALSNMAVAWVYILLPMMFQGTRPIDDSVPAHVVLAHAHQFHVVQFTLALVLIIGLVCFQAWWPLQAVNGDGSGSDYHLALAALE